MSTKKFDVERVQRLQKELAEVDGTTEMPALIKRLKQKEGLRFRKHAETGLIFVSLAGVAAKSKHSEDEALRNWGNAARRAMLQEA
ncbi:hypothetical protein [Pseudooceanicola sp.]|uniref:hypothetical protein n=1 Tax=Pseudooceanicola sp. TaxID=1914328 RepID=UPI00405877FC